MTVDWVMILSTKQAAVMERCLECGRPFLSILSDGGRVPERCKACLARATFDATGAVTDRVT